MTKCACLALILGGFLSLAEPPASTFLSASILPKSGGGYHQTFDVKYQDRRGYQDLAWVHIRIPSAGSFGMCWIAYDVLHRDVSLADDRGSNWSHATPGSRKVLKNSQCAVDVEKFNSSGSGDILTVQAALTFTAAFAGYKTVYLRAESKDGSTLDYTALGEWNIPDTEGRPEARSVSPISTGTHWPEATEFSRLAGLNFRFAVVAVNPGDTSRRRQLLEAAGEHGIQLIIGAYPAPFKLRADGSWNISDQGVQFLKDLASHSSAVLAIYGFNEPYWIDPSSGRSDPCGVLSASQLRALRTKIRSIWADAKIYHDIGDPQSWSPSGSAWKPCVGSKYEDQSGVADYVGIWSYPFVHSRYDRQLGLDFVYRASRYVLAAMRAKPVFLAQSFACNKAPCAADGITMPTPAQLKDWNCSVRSTLPSGSLLSWYVWQQRPLYSDFLSNHPELWPFTKAAACDR